MAAIGDALAAVAALSTFASIVRTIAALTREIRKSRLKDPVAPPDFSMLGDGTQRVRDLEAMAGSEGDTIREKKIATTEARPSALRLRLEERHRGALAASTSSTQSAVPFLP